MSKLTDWLPLGVGATTARLSEKVRDAAYRLIPVLDELVRNQTVPIAVSVDQRIPIDFDQPIELPIVLNTKVNVDHEIDFEADIPVHTELDMDTTVQTSVLGLGSIKVPIKAKIPLNMVLPVKTRIRLNINGLPINIDDKMNIRLPKMETPLKTTLNTKIKLV